MTMGISDGGLPPEELEQIQLEENLEAVFNPQKRARDFEENTNMETGLEQVNELILTQNLESQNWPKALSLGLRLNLRLRLSLRLSIRINLRLEAKPKAKILIF